MTGPSAIRSLRINELTNKLLHLIKVEGKTAEEAMMIVRARAYEMAEKTTAEKYLAEVVRRVSK